MQDIVAIRRNTFLLIELLFIASIMDSQPASCPAQTSSGPTDVIMSIRLCVTTILPVIRYSASAIPIGRSPEFLSSGIIRQSRKA